MAGMSASILKPSHAAVRPPAISYMRAISSSQAPIDVPLALRQHAEYCKALAAAGLAVETLPPDERYPDSCFMQDPALVIAGQGIVGRLAADSRSGEEESVAAWLAARVPLTYIIPPGTLEGGDVMVLPHRVLVGASGRSNGEGIQQLAAILQPLGLPATPVPVAGYLHLLTAATYLGGNLLLAVEDYATHPVFAGFDVIEVPPAEAYAANALVVDMHVVLPAGYPRTTQALQERGFSVMPVPMTEFAKADGGITCLSLVW